MGKERIGIMGGTFDPVHAGHIQLARYALKSANLDRVLLVPDGISPHKDITTPAEDRWRMLQIATCQEKGIEPVRTELDRNEVTRPLQMLKDLKGLYPKSDFFFILGADSVMRLSHWESLSDILKMCTFLVAPRKNDTESADFALRFMEQRRFLTGQGAKWQTIDMPLSDVSSSSIRASYQSGIEPDVLSAPLREYCAAKGLYGLSPCTPSAPAWLDQLFSALTIKRFSHTLSVAYTARNLARNHHIDTSKAEIAGLLHDCAKCLPLEEMQRICREHALTIDALTFSSGNLLHAIAGSYLAETSYGVHDPDILRAISCHTTGKVGMTKLDMVVYLADKIEPTRPTFPVLNKVRILAPLSLEKAMLASMEGTRDYVKHGEHPLHPQTERTIAWLRTLPETCASNDSQ